MTKDEADSICFDLFHPGSSNINWFNPVYEKLRGIPEKYQKLFKEGLQSINLNEYDRIN